MKRECCHPRAKRGIAALIEILVVAVLILGGMAVYFGMFSGGRGGGGLADPTGTTQALEIQQNLESGPASQAPAGRPAEGVQPRSTPAPAPAAASNPTPASNGTSVIVPSSIPGKAIGKARGQQCLENLRELRMMIQITTDDNGGTFPVSLTDVDGSSKVRACPTSGQDYVYDPATGKVHCPAPGHEGF